MRTLLIILSVLLYLPAAWGQIGKRSPSEKQIYIDPVTGIPITVLTSTEKSDRALYQTDPMWTADQKYIIFRSSGRTDGKQREITLPSGEKRMVGPRAEMFFIEESTGEIIQATEGEDTEGVYLAHHTNRMFLFRKVEEDKVMFVVNLDSLFKDSKEGKMKGREHYETRIGTFPRSSETPGGFAVDCNDDYAYITVGREETEADRKKAKDNKAAKFSPRDDQPKKVAHGLSGIRKMNLVTGEVSFVMDADFRIGHIQTSLFTPGEIVYCHETGGDAPQRMWFCTADGKINRPLYEETPLDWVTHETFATKDHVYFNILGWQERLRKQAHGIMRINIRTNDVDFIGQVEADKDRSASEGGLVGRGFWHCNASRDGKWAAGDTFAGNVWVINTETGQKHLLATNTRMKPDHAHPYFSPDGNRILFQSGYLSNGERLQLMLVNLPEYLKY